MRHGDAQFDPRELFATLVRHDVAFIVIGGIAGRLHGSVSMTGDLDVCYARDLENLERLAAALRELRVELRGADRGLPFTLDARTLRAGLNFTFTTIHGDLDCLGDASGGFTYALLEPNAEPMDVGDVRVRVTSLDDLIRMKRAAGRARDLIEVENLSALREVREGASPYRVRRQHRAR